MTKPNSYINVTATTIIIRTLVKQNYIKVTCTRKHEYLIKIHKLLFTKSPDCTYKKLKVTKNIHVNSKKVMQHISNDRN